jgi:hypothetical protein
LSDQPQENTRAATNVPEFVSELDAGQFENMFSTAVSEVAAATLMHEKKGEVAVVLKFSHIPGTSQVRIESITKFKRPTPSGSVIEDAKGATVMHVGPRGRLTLTQPPLPGMDRQQSLPITR